MCEYVCVVCGHDQRCPTPGSAAKGNRCVTIDYVSANVQRRPSRKRMAHDWRLDDVCVWVCVCVYHLNRCKTSYWFSLICRGPGTHDCLSWPTKTRQHGGENVPASF